MRKYLYLFTVITLFIFTGCATKEYPTEVFPIPGNKPTQNPYSVNGKIYIPKKYVPIGWTQKGIASWYGYDFHGKLTSSGEIYNMYKFTAAHKTLPINTLVKVINLKNGKSVVVRINDRGPFVKNRIIDLSYAAAKKIGMDRTGIAPVKIIVIGKNYKEKYKIQIGAFRSYKSAEILSKKYQKLGYNIKIKNVKGLKKVYIVGFPTYKKAKKFLAQNGINGFIVGD